MKYLAFVFFLFGAVLPARLTWAQANPCGYDRLTGFQSCFKVYDYDTKQEITNPVLCAGRRITIRDCSGANFSQGLVRYRITGAPGNATSPNCWPNFSFAPVVDTITTGILVPTTLGANIRIHQSTPRPSTIPITVDPNVSGLVFSRDFEVRTTPMPTFTLARCGLNQEQVRVTITPQPNVEYFVQVGSAARVAATAPSATYPTNGATTVTVFGRYTDAALCEGSSTPQAIPTLPARVVPVLSRLAVQGSSLVFTFSALQAEYRYELRQSGATPPVTVLAGGATSFTLPNASLAACYSLRQTDVCETLLNESAALCPVVLTATPADRRNQLAWVTSTGSVSGFEITRNGQPLATVAAGTTSYTDSAVTCGATYRYQVTARTAQGASVSDERPVTTTATQPPRTPQLTASFTIANAVELALLVPARDTSDQLLVRRNFGAASQELTLPRRPPLLDQPGAVSVALVPCYSARFRDPCGNTSLESTVCPPALDARAADEAGNSVQLQWVAPSGQGTDWVYRLLLVDANGAVLRTLTPTGPDNTLLDSNPPTDRQILRYRLEATASNGTRVFSNTASVTRQVRITVPTAFTPNGDGLNDVLQVKGRFISNFTFTVYNRDGVVVFRSSDLATGWDGRINGALAAPQPFPYQVEVTDETGKRVLQRGTVTLLR